MSSLATAPSLLLILSASLLLLVVSTIVRYAAASRRPKNFPPGPPSLPLIGNLHIFPKKNAFLKFHEWGKQYGDIIGLKLGPQNVVVLNDWRHVQELFDKRGGIYSDRPDNHIANDLIYQNGSHILFVPYGEKWRMLRKAFQTLLNVKTVDTLLPPIQSAEATATAHDLLTDPDAWYDHIRRFTTAVSLASVFGLRGTSFQSSRVKDLYRVLDQVTEITMLGATPPIDIFPVLKALPDFLCPWRLWARDIRAEEKAFFFGLVEESKRSWEVGGEDAPDCFLRRLVGEQGKSGLSDEDVAYTCGASMDAGSDTTASTLLSFLLAMVKNPAILAKCQREVDAQCGSDRSPDFEDLDNLPYLRATMNETLRYRPVAASGVPHAVTQDDWYEGYLIPKGTILFANPWSIHRTSEYADPDAFVPERFLDDKFGIDSAAQHKFEGSQQQRRVQYGFGAGRRVCSGQRLAENSMMMCMAKLVWSFNLTNPTPGVPIDDDIANSYHGGFLVTPKKFPLRFEARSELHARVVRREYREVAVPFLRRFKE